MHHHHHKLNIDSQQMLAQNMLAHPYYPLPSTRDSPYICWAMVKL